MPKNILHTILETKRKEVAHLKTCRELEALRDSANSAAAVRDFFSAVTKPSRGLLNLIAEVKKASPSAGVIREDFDPVEIARMYQAGGADTVSVLTDSKYFQGSLEYLQAVRQAVSLPVLRKDFIIDPWQVYESRAAGADAILLIAAALEVAEMTDLASLATELKMTVLIEVHNADELQQVKSAVKLSSPANTNCLLGINNRDLTTFNVDIGTTVKLAGLAGDDVPIVSESGIKTRRDVETLAQSGVNAMLVGETLMRCEDASSGIEKLVGRGA